MPAIESISPTTGEVLARFEPNTAAQIEATIALAHDAFHSWRRGTVAERAVPMRALGQLLRDRRAEYARLITLEMGKPISEALAEIDKCALTCDFFAEEAATYLSASDVTTSARQSYVAFEPLGVILAVMPWNYPFWQVVRFLAPALMAGNAAVIKHASNVTQCAIALVDAIAEAGFPRGLVGLLLAQGAAVEPLIADPRIRALTLTGSTATGMRLASLAGQSIKKAVLELGGSDPFIVLRDADLAAAAATAVKARFLNAGQTCIAAKRILVEAPVAAEFEEHLAREIRALRVGDPLDPTTTIGPLARADLRDALEDQVAASVAMGARVVVDGGRRDGAGWFFGPALLADVTEDMPVAREETFGPVAVVIRVESADDALRIANSSPYGLSAALWTNDIEAARDFARHLETGAVFVNGMTVSDPRLPFGGVKQSGYGRELSVFGIREFVNIQTIWIGPADGVLSVPRAE